jgi:hypothetical protein
MTQSPYSFKTFFELGLKSFLPVITFDTMLDINLGAGKPRFPPHPLPLFFLYCKKEINVTKKSNKGKGVRGKP